MKFVQLIAIGLIAGAFASGTAQAKPNVLLIIADDMGLDASRCYKVGSNQAPMPNVEKLCADGLVFDNAYAAPVCSPTRATIMTGKYGFRTGVGSAISRRGSGNGLSSDEKSLFDALSATDYRSAVIGKWHLANSRRDLDHPASLGVKDYFGLFSGGIRDYFNWEAIENGKRVAIDGYSTTVLTDRAIKWIDAAKEKPWFLWLAYNAPHTPFHLPPDDLHSAGSLPTDKRSIRQNPLPYYNAMLEALDTEIGRLLGTLSDEVRQNTVVIFIGDNGTPGQVARKFYGPRRAKGSIFEGGTHVPMVVSGPGVINGRSSALMNTTDLHATIAELAGVKTDAVDSISLASVFKGQPGKRKHVYVEHFSDSGGRRPDVFGWAIRDDRYKLVAEDGKAEMLFDLNADPLERDNLLSKSVSADIGARLEGLKTGYEKLRGDR